MQAKQILFYIIMRNITEYHPTYYSDNQSLFRQLTMMSLKLMFNPIENKNYELTTITNKSSKWIILWFGKWASVYKEIEDDYCDFVRKINRRGYGNFKKHEYPINPDGYAI